MQQRLVYIIIALLIFALEIGIFFSGIPFIRNSLGDFFVVILMFVLVKSVFPKINGFYLAIGIFLYSVLIEVLQLFHFPELFGTEKTWVKIILGSQFTFHDILMYLLGTIAVYYFDVYLQLNKKLNSSM